MKRHVLVISVILLLAMAVQALPPQRARSSGPTAATLRNDVYINANQILMFVTNQGIFARDKAGVFGHDYGTYWPYVSNNFIEDGTDIRSPLYASGLWVGGVDQATGDTLVVVAEFDAEYTQGPADTIAFDRDDPLVRPYKLYLDSLAGNPNQDYLDWIHAARQGAPFVGKGDPLVADDSATPVMMGDQMVWAVYNDLEPGKHGIDAGDTDPLNIEIQQTTFAFKRENPLNDIVFLKFQVYNRGTIDFTDTYISLWADPDLGGASDDLVGCDTILSLGFVYNADNDDADYGSQPPCLGYDFFQGPLVVGTAEDTAKAWGTTWPGYRTLGMVSFNKYINGTDPINYQETYRFMNGLNADGTPLANGTTYQFPGDPVRSLGDLDFAPADRRFMQTTGPINLAPGDSVEILAGIVVAQGINRKSSISKMKYWDRFAQKAYDDDFVVPNPPMAPEVTLSELNGEIALYWDNRSELNPGSYPFEGYTVYQGPTPSGPWTAIANYAVTNATIQDEYFNEATGQVEITTVKVPTDDPVKYSALINEDFLVGGPLRNLTRYFYRVGAYTYDETKLPKILESATLITATPQPSVADSIPSFGALDTIEVEHIAGVSDGSIFPVVVDPRRLNGHTYDVTFREQIIGVDTTLLWNLIDITAEPDDTVFKDQTDFSGGDGYLISDAFMLKVSGPTDPFKNFSCVARGDGPLDPPEGAAAASFQGFPGVDPTTRQQVSGQRWLITTGDNGGSSGGGNRGPYATFKTRTVRNDDATRLGVFDYEVRFTGSLATPGTGGSLVLDFNEDPVSFWVPFELWNIGIATPGDASDDVRLTAAVLENDNTTVGLNDVFGLENWGADPTGNGGFEHSISGGDNDPYTEWIYWFNPADMTPGQSGYQADSTAMAGGTFVLDFGKELMARMVFAAWNGGTAPPFPADCPEQGTIFRIETGKPLEAVDHYRFVASPVQPVARTESALGKISVVPNPFYLFSAYDPAPGNRQLKFQHLPSVCTISIYNLAGDLVDRIEKTDGSTSVATWDLNTTAGLPVASGIYIWVVEAPGIGQKVGKMAVFMEVEVLELY